MTGERHPGLWGWLPETPKRKWPRHMRTRVQEVLAVGGTVFGRGILGYTSIDGRKIYADTPNYIASGGSLANSNSSEIAFRRFHQFNPPSKTLHTIRWMRRSIHGFMDPDQAAMPYTLVAQDLVFVEDVLGTDNWAGFGFFDVNTAHDWASAVGVYWEYDQSTTFWRARVKDGTGSPSNSLHSVDSGIAASAIHRLAIALGQGQARFYIDGNLSSTYAPTAGSLPGQFGTTGCPYFGYGVGVGETGVNDELRLHMWGGTNPCILQLIGD